MLAPICQRVWHLEFGPSHSRARVLHPKNFGTWDKLPAQRSQRSPEHLKTKRAVSNQEPVSSSRASLALPRSTAETAHRAIGSFFPAEVPLEPYMMFSELSSFWGHNSQHATAGCLYSAARVWSRDRGRDKVDWRRGMPRGGGDFAS